MKWNDQRRSGNVEDRRGSGGGFGGGFGRGLRGGGFPLPGGRLGGGGLAILAIVALITIFAGDPLHLLGDATGLPRGEADPSQAQAADFVSVVLADTEDVWHELFAARGLSYREPRLVLFDDEVDSACGYAGAATGPFYCPADGKVYLDLRFFDELARGFGAPGDFAQAYVVAHEVGHHVQHLLGVSEEVSALQQRAARGEANALSVRLELQADFYAGVWAHHAQRLHGILEPGDIDEALAAATAIGDDRLQRQEQGRAVPDSFTHGTSAQRALWFRRGWDTGDMDAGDTFAAKDLSHP
ncbi:MAG TPA: neutral zinc metallopeptidase [Planctomycetota bacterium]|nr:neutral zinc metallopeptidase [Planctomycetota bacterium]